MLHFTPVHSRRSKEEASLGDRKAVKKLWAFRAKGRDLVVEVREEVTC